MSVTDMTISALGSGDLVTMRWRREGLRLQDQDPTVHRLDRAIVAQGLEDPGHRRPRRGDGLGEVVLRDLGEEGRARRIPTGELEDPPFDPAAEVAEREHDDLVEGSPEE